MWVSQAWAEIYASQYGRLVTLMTVLCGSVADAEEAVQEAFARGLGLWGRRTPPEDPAAWLYRVAVNVLRGKWRRALVAHRHRGTLAVEPPVAAADHADDRLMLVAALRGLPAEQRETLALHYLADLPIAAIADRMDVPVGTVKARLSRGRNALAAMLSSDIPSGDDPRSVRQPEFSAIRQRGARRARRRIAAAAAILTAIVATGVVWGSSRLFRPEPVTPTPAPTVTTPAPSPSASNFQPPAQGQHSSESITVAVGGNVFVVRRECPSKCETDGQIRRARLLHTADLGRTWTDGGLLPAEMWPERVLRLAGDEQALWIVGIDSLWGSADGGKTWQRWPIAGSGDFEVRAGRLWLTAGDRVVTVAPGAAPKPASAGLPTGSVLRLVARTAGSALALVYARPDGANWYGTEDSGQSWQKMPNPCAATPHTDPEGSDLGATGDGKVLWASCAALGTVVQRIELVVSTDSGRTWQSRKAMDNAHTIVRLHPFSERVAWRYDTLLSVYRTEDGQAWTTVALELHETASTFVAVDAATALILGDHQLQVTIDGGKTWQQRPMPG